MGKDNKLFKTTKQNKKKKTNLIHLVELANYIQSNIRKFILQKREKYWQKLLDCGILQYANH